LTNSKLKNNNFTYLKNRNPFEQYTLPFSFIDNKSSYWSDFWRIMWNWILGELYWKFSLALRE